MAASALALSLASVPLPALAATGELRSQEMSEGYGRIILSFNTAPKTVARVSNGILVVSFSESSTVNVERIMRDMPAYVSMARSDPDGRGLRFALTRGYRVNVTEAGEQIFIDLLPESWKGMLPGLPKEVVEELTRRARMAEIKAREASRQKEAEKPIALGIKASQTATLTRLIIDAPSSMPVAHRVVDGQAEVIIDRHVTLDPAAIKPLLPAGARIVAADSGPAGLRLALSPPDGWSLRSFREDEQVVIDFVQPKAKASPEQEILAEMAKAQPTAPVKPQEKSQEASRMPEAAKPSPEPQPAEIKQTTPATVARVAEAQRTEMERIEAPRAVSIAAQKTDAGIRMDIDFARQTGAAAFERDGLATLVFDSQQSFDPDMLKKAASIIGARIEAERQAQLVVLRIEAGARPLVRL
ncbi:MAG: hypothetical protein ACRCWO_13875, partial [Bosea sp. (in: a-proteobacteria)]